MSGPASRLLGWFGRCARDLPWRRTRDPYAVWVSEAMLQQTRIATVVPRYEAWMRRFPTLETLAAVGEAEVVEAWAGLGYYARARRLAEGAKHVVREGWPSDAAGWRRVPGVGAYTAGALASIALGQDEPAVDGNVVRVYSRVAADPAPTETRARSWSKSLMPAGRAAEWNQALMELGATVCLPRSPACGECPLAPDCRARQEGRTGEFPPRRPKPAATEATLHVWVLERDGRVGLRPVPEGAWWQGLWEAPSSLDPGSLALEYPGAAPRRVGEFAHAVTRHRLRVVVSRGDGPAVSRLEWHPAGHVGRGLSAPSSKAIKLAFG